MSPERPPSHDSGGGGGGSISSGGNIGSLTRTIDSTTNMVLSTIPPIESGHVIIQQHQQHQHRIATATTPTSVHQVTNGVNTYTQIHGNSPTSIITKPVISSTNGSPSKYVFFQQNGNPPHVTSESATTAYIAGSQTNNIGNIVLVTTEPMEVNSSNQISGQNGNGTDEELTSLTWLHDKNLIKGIVACTNSKSAAASPARQSNTGALSPTSDLEDSCVSEDNASSANSNSDQGISVHNADYSPTGHHNGSASFAVHRHQIQASHFSQAPHHNHIQYTNNNNSISKNRNLIISPSTTAMSTTSGPPGTFVMNSSVPDHLVDATTTVHVGPSGTTTVVEYKAGSNFITSPRSHIPQVPSSPRRTPPANNNTVLVTSSTISTSSTPPTSTGTNQSAHQHFHKKYIREQQINGQEQNVQQNNMQNGGQQFNSNITNGSGAPFSPTQASCPPDVKDFMHSTPVKQQPLSLTFNHEPVVKEEIDYESPTGGKVQTIQKPIASPKQKHPTNVPYDPLVHTHNKPPYSFSSLIFMAIENSPEKALPVKEIYAWIVQHFPYYKTAPTGWKNSVRHNLSLNKSFLKVEKAPNMGKGSLWRVEHTQRANLIQALTRSPFYPGTVANKIGPLKAGFSQSPESPPSTPTKSTLDARLFPKLSKMIKEMVTKGNEDETGSEVYKVTYAANGSISNGSGGPEYYSNELNGSTPHYDTIERLARDCGADSIDDVNAATAMLALKHGPKVFSETLYNGSPVITSSPSEDHTYSAGGGGGNGSNSGNRSQNGSDNNSNGASSDAAYESSEESPSHEASAEEMRRHIEGVDALLSFASKVSSMSSSGASSPVKRPATDDEHISSYRERDSNSLTNSASEDDSITHQQHAFSTQTYYSSMLSLPSPPKKLKTSRNLRNKMKRKSTWIR